MTAWRRWQDWATVLLGIIAIATPFVFAIDLAGSAAWSAYVLGGLLVLSGLWSASTSEPNAGIEWIPAIVGIALLAAPWLVNYTTVTELAWMSWIVGVLAILNSGGELLFLGQTPTAGHKPV